MIKQAFLPMLFRMKHIARWGLMHSTLPESLTQHSAECAFVTHFLAVIGNVYLGASHNAGELAARALYHDATEILTGDLPTPVKYYNADIQAAYKGIETDAAVKLLDGLPEEMRGVYAQCVLNETESVLIKAADRLCAYIKCLGEVNAGNREFEPPLKACREKVNAMAADCPELKYFMEHFIDAFTLSLDDLQAAL